MKIIITGALGHIGSHLIRRLPEIFPACEILMIDNLSTQRYSSLFNLPQTAKYSFLEGDVTKMDLNFVLKGTDVVIHLAALTDAAASFDKKDEVEKINLTATDIVSDACITANVPMIMASSTSVYGTQEDQVDENCKAEELMPQSPYAETKLKEEALIMDKVDKNSLRAIIFRYGTIYGTSPGMRFHTAVNKFCWQAIMGIPLTVWTTAYEQKRPYLDIDDCVRGIAFAIKNDLFSGKVYNLVTTNATVRNVIEHIQLKVPDIQVEFVEHKIMNQLSYEVLNTRLTKEGFSVEGNLADSIHNTLSILMSANNSNVNISV